jgi:hypothetical protein
MRFGSAGEVDDDNLADESDAIEPTDFTPEADDPACDAANQIESSELVSDAA